MADHESSASVAAGDDYFTHYLNRTILLFGEEAVQTLRGKTVAIAGAGGHGGAACLTLARMGVGGFVLADPKPFDEPDINRQWGANRSTLGRNKAEVYAEMLLAINPEIRIRKLCEGITEENVERFLEDADLLIDCLDISVPASLRAKVFAGARARGMHAFTAAMLGFGGMIAGSFPGGLPLELVGGIEDVAIAGSKLPKSLRDVFVPEYMERIEEYLHIHRAPSIAISPAFLGTMLSVEAAVTLLGNTIPGWRPPICLPHLLLVDLLRLNFRVVHLNELLLNRPLIGSAVPLPNVEPPTAPPVTGLSEDDRRSVLAGVGYNTYLLPFEASNLDLLTDSWSEIPSTMASSTTPDSSWSAASAEQAIQGLYGYKWVVPVSRGRFAEGLLCKALGRPGSLVISNALFPTTQFHLETNGYTVRELVREEAYDPQSGSCLFKGDLDLERLKETLSESENVAAIYVELCVNALGGHPVSMGNLAKVRELAEPRGIPVILDAVRAFENAALIRQRESGFEKCSLVKIVTDICSLSDACASSCAKDFRTSEGGFIGVSAKNEALFNRIRDLTIAFGDGLTKASRQALVHALAVSPESTAGPVGRVAQVQLLWKMLSQRSIPVVSPVGGHAVFVDARAMLPHIPADQFPAQALANALFLAGGVGAAPNFASPGIKKRDLHLVRLAIPVGYCGDEALDRVAHTFELVLRNREKITGLRRVGGPPGAAGDFAAEYRPIGKS